MPAAASDLMKDKTTAEGAFDLPYAMPNRRVEHVLTHEPVPVGFWRSVGHSYNAFFTECFPRRMRARRGQGSLRVSPRDARARAALPARCSRPRRHKAGWGTPLPAGHGRGIASAESFHSIVAQVAEVEIVDNAPRVRRVVCAVDCGFAVDPANVAAQMESGIVFGLTAALYGEITAQGTGASSRATSTTTGC